ncbi:MAG: hypothetical protein K0S74_684 [Chlamydiales bacterium]|jgi:hypothetical protein|nr:hypothetical protein [Chlamydiales bacterium]
MFSKRFLLCSLGLIWTFNSISLYAASLSNLPFSKEDIDANINSPTFVNGKITTTEGGHLHIPSIDLRIQAKHIEYGKESSESHTQDIVVRAEKQIVLEYQGRMFIAEKLEYNLTQQTGVLYNARTISSDWLIKGEKITLYADKSYVIEQASLTTTPSDPAEWRIEAKNVRVDAQQQAHVNGISVYAFQGHLFSKQFTILNLAEGNYLPLQIKVSRRGVRFRYRLYSKNGWNNIAYLDYRYRAGLGAGLNVRYQNRANNTKFYGQNYVARGKTSEKKKTHTRYRFAGSYRKESLDRNWLIEGSYDRLSDPGIISNFKLDTFNEEKQGRTQIFAQRKENPWMITFLSRVKVNSFENVKQELPTIHADLRPIQLGNSGIFTHNHLSASFLDYKYNHKLRNHSSKQFQNYHSGRFSFDNRFYAPLSVSTINITPFAGFNTTAYTDSPQKKHRSITTGILGVNASLPLHKHYEVFKHVTEPYIEYEYRTKPQHNYTKIHIFDMHDMRYKHNMLRWGVRNHFYSHDSSEADPLMFVDLYAHSSMRKQKNHKHTPNIHGQIIWNPTKTVSYHLNTAWNTKHHNWNHCNLGLDYTYNENLALGAEIRHRKKYSWRKLDSSNYSLESTYDEFALRNSRHADPRNTFLTKLYYRIAPDCKALFETQHGWRRPGESKYYRYQLGLETQLESKLKLKIIFQHTKREKFAFMIGITT